MVKKNKFYPIKKYRIDEIDENGEDPIEDGLEITQDGRIILYFGDKIYYLEDASEEQKNRGEEIIEK